MSDPVTQIVGDKWILFLYSGFYCFTRSSCSTHSPADSCYDPVAYISYKDADYCSLYISQAFQAMTPPQLELQNLSVFGENIAKNIFCVQVHTSIICIKVSVWMSVYSCIHTYIHTHTHMLGLLMLWVSKMCMRYLHARSFNDVSVWMSKMCMRA